jgi:hypothetical protein
VIRLLTALFLLRKLPLFTALFIGLALLLPLFFILSMLARWIAPPSPPPRGSEQHHSQSHAPAYPFGPSPAKAAITKDLRPEIERAFRQHNRETTESLRNLSNSYETGIRAYQQKHPIVPQSQ